MSKKIEEEQIDEISQSLAHNYLKKAVDKDNNLKPERVAGATMIARKELKRRGIDQGKLSAKVPLKKSNWHVQPVKESEQIDEISNKTLTSYMQKAHRKIIKMKEEVECLDEGLRLLATHKSESGKHTAKVYKDSEWGEHRVKFHINGKHHPGSDYHTDDADDAHDTARHELKRLDKLNGALKEDIEQIDEISKKTLGSYIRRANADQGQAHRDHVMDMFGGANHKTLTSHLKRAEKRNDGIRKAVDRLTKEDIEQIDELSKTTLNRYVKRATTSLDHNSYNVGHHDGRIDAGAFNSSIAPTDAASKADRNSINRKKGIRGAVDRLTKEEVEQIDEISKKTLGSYINKASREVSRHSYIGGFNNGVSYHPDSKTSNKLAIKKDHEPITKSISDHSKKESKRLNGIRKATEHLTKEDLEDLTDDQLTEEHFEYILENMTIEEYEQLDEISKKTLGNYIKTASNDMRGYQDHKTHNMSKMNADDHDTRRTARNAVLKSDRKISNRWNGINKAVNRLTKEEIGRPLKDILAESEELTKYDEANS